MSGITNYRYLPSMLQLGGVVVAAFTAVKGYSVYTYLRNYMTSKVDCQFGKTEKELNHNFKKYLAGANAGNPQDQYCLGKMYKFGNGTKPSNLDALNLFKEASDQGLAIAQEELCNPSLYCGIKLQELSKIFFSELEYYCCPPQTPCINPWDVPLEMMTPTNQASCMLSLPSPS